MHSQPTRRRFIQGAIAATLAAPILANAAKAEKTAPKFKKAVKFAMIQTKGSIKEKFELIKSIGFLGCEFDSPGDFDRDEAVKAQEETGIKIHGVIDSVHWKERLSDPDAAVRAKGVEALKTAIADAKRFGSTSILLVPGRVEAKTDESYEQCWSRSQEEIKKVLPLVADSGARLAIEVVWNNFITKPSQFVEYIDSFNDPHVGGYFDCSNMVRYGIPDAEWIHALGPRLVKFDFKGFSLEKFKTDPKKAWVPIGEGDENWPETVKALDAIGYHGWATAEVAGGGEKELKDVNERMDRVLELK
jgi:hexulose-6-phosphate isomerase